MPFRMGAGARNPTFAQILSPPPGSLAPALIPAAGWETLRAMKSCFGMILAILVLIAVLGTLGGIYYLSSTTEFAPKTSTSP